MTDIFFHCPKCRKFYTPAKSVTFTSEGFEIVCSECNSCIGFIVQTSNTLKR